ncbi:Uncharacterized protein OBRU01_23054 [Operophtera brumata]|uniref:Peptidase S1 domain-containing protein n=1 Tax=Operophtera brumata TaxID=104452 RepID=A0A0L7KQ77_OPEBR|nr:Uncharacterized protein OBRU01_23054 [Operophtera brumata]
MKHKCAFIVFVLVILSVYGQYEQSPCPGLFSYRSDGDSVFGHITLKPSGGPVRTTYIGRIEAIGNDQLLQMFNRGVPLQYRVHFPVTSPLPRLTSIAVNGNTLCYGPGDVPGPNQYVTTLSLDHKIFLKPGSNPQIFNPYQNPVSDLDFVGHLDDNTQVFTINDIGNRDGTWNSGYPMDPYLVVNNTRPEYEPPEKRPVYERPAVRPTQPRPNRPQPEYTQHRPSPDYNVYYPEQTTQSTRPPPSPPPPTAEVRPSTPPRLPAASAVECGVIARENEGIPLIFQGDSYQRGDWPWLVAIYKRQEGSLTFICAGTLVSERHVITAAHCMHQRSKISTIKDIVVKVGVFDLEDWGDDISGEPRMVHIPVVSTSACRASKPVFHTLTSSKTLCAGDSGGGLYILDNGRWRLRGVVSLSLRSLNGENTCNLNEYIIFTDSAQYVMWIKNIMSQNLYDF